MVALILTAVQREWLIAHGLLRSDAQKTRDELVAHMNNYYYDTKASTG
jgi:hypothetical protein